MTPENRCKHKVNSERLVEIGVRRFTERVQNYIKAYEGKGCYNCSGTEDVEGQCFFYSPPRWTEL